MHQLNDILSCLVCEVNMVEISIPFAPPPGSPDNPVAFINDIYLFTALEAGQTFLAHYNVMELTFNVTIDPAVLMTKFQISTNGETVDVKVQPEEIDTILNLTVISLIHTHIFYQTPRSDYFP